MRHRTVLRCKRCNFWLVVRFKLTGRSDDGAVFISTNQSYFPGSIGKVEGLPSLPCMDQGSTLNGKLAQWERTILNRTAPVPDLDEEESQIFLIEQRVKALYPFR